MDDGPGLSQLEVSFPGSRCVALLLGPAMALTPPDFLRSSGGLNLII